LRRLAIIGVAALALVGCGDTDTDPSGGTERSSQLTECLKEADLDVQPADNKEGSSRAFTVRNANGKVTTYAYVFEAADKAKAAQKKIFKPKDEETVSAYVAGDTLVINTHAAADSQPEISDCFAQPTS